MVFRGAAALIVRLSRTLISRPIQPIIAIRTHQISHVNKYPTRFYLFPSIYRSSLNSINAQNLPNLMPFRLALNAIKRQLFFAAPGSSRLLLGLLGYSLVQQASINQFNLDETVSQIGNLLSKTTTVDQFNSENQKYTRAAFDDFELGRLLGCGCNAAVYEARLRSSDILPPGQFNLAIKMLFNYGIQSNAQALEKAMEKELLPLRKCSHHSNIVRMYSCFVDSFPLLNEAHEYYPMAIPTRLSSDGYGRNKTLFIVMKRYDLTLNEYIKLNQPNTHERLLLFVQLIEALLYLNNHSIVHRDLKSDNLLVCNATGELVLADFGCALYYPPDLKILYQTDEICKGGNTALMAPEILTCQPGPNCYLDYNKADLWASGTLCYEFFSQSNPFFHGSLRQEDYDDENLPSLSSIAPPIIERLVHSILRKNPEKRPSILLVSNCIHLYLWFESMKCKTELYQTYMWTALETLFNKHSLTHVELNLKKLFFQRQTSQSLYRAQTFLNQL